MTYQPEPNVENRICGTGRRGDTRNHDTLGSSRGADGRLAGTCGTSDIAFKIDGRFGIDGRVGDSPQVGRSLNVEAGIGAASSTGVGEEVTRIAGSAPNGVGFLAISRAGTVGACALLPRFTAPSSGRTGTPASRRRPASGADASRSRP